MSQRTEPLSPLAAALSLKVALDLLDEQIRELPEPQRTAARQISLNRLNDTATEMLRAVQEFVKITNAAPCDPDPSRLRR